MEKNVEYCINVVELANRLGVSRARAYQLANSAGFPSIRLGKRLLISVKGLEKWIEDQNGKQAV